MITSAKDSTKINIKIRNKSVADSKPQIYSCSQSPPPQFWGWFFVYSGIPHMQGTSSWLWGFNLLLLRLHGDISLSLLCSHNSWGSAFVLVPPLCVGHPQAFILHPDSRSLKQRLIMALLLTQARAREGDGSYNWNAGWACIGRGQGDVATAWGTQCVLLVNLSLDHGMLAVAYCTGSQGVVDSGPVLAHRTLGGCSSSVSISCPSLWSELIAVAHTCLCSSFRQCSAFFGQTRKESPLFAHPKTMVSCLLGRSRLFPEHPPG